MAQGQRAEVMGTHLRRPTSLPRPRRRSGCRAIAGCVALAGSLLAHRAVADGEVHLTVEWDKLGALLSRDDASSRLPWRPDAERPTPPAPRIEPPMLLDAPQGPRRWSLVARDWEAARLLMGRLAPTDEVKRGRSKRMVLLRGRFDDGPLVPYVQVGLGQWRIDPDTPAMPHDPVFAGQIGAGMELALASWVSIAIETDCTLLDPGRPETPDTRPPVRHDAALVPRETRWVRPPALWGSFLALRAQF